MNPGSQIFGQDAKDKLDIGIRRMRMISKAQIHPKIFVFTQFGINNFNAISQRKSEFFIHDIWASYDLLDNKFSLGGGLTAFGGYARYSMPSAASILTYDLPLFQQSTADINDQFLRALSIFAKGQLGQFDYRIALSDPLAIQQASSPPSTDLSHSTFSLELPNKVVHGYFKYHFKEIESNKVQSMKGSYLGAKEILNTGTGFKFQKDAMWRIENTDTIKEDIMLMSLDIFYEKPIDKKKGNTYTFYGGYFYNYYGKDYLRNRGVMNPANGLDINKASFNGAGNNFPMNGTGNIIHTHSAYLISKSSGLQPFASFTVLILLG